MRPFRSGRSRSTPGCIRQTTAPIGTARRARGAHASELVGAFAWKAVTVGAPRVSIAALGARLKLLRSGERRARVVELTRARRFVTESRHAVRPPRPCGRRLHVGPRAPAKVRR